MKDMHELKEKLCRELEDYSRQPEMKAGDLEVIHKLTDTIKNIGKIEMLEEGGAYSEAGGYDGGSSYANRGQHYVRGHYSRDGGMNRDGMPYSDRRDGRGRYSRDGGYSRNDGRSEMLEHLEMALDAADERDRDAIKRFMHSLETA